MTVIAYRAGVMAADNIAWDENNHQVGTAEKIVRLPDGGLLGCFGDAGAIMRLRAWFMGGCIEAEKPNLEKDSIGVILAHPDGTASKLVHDLTDQQTKADFYVLSCKAGFTLGALYAGASAEEAVRLTLMHTDAGCGGNPHVQVERVGLT